MQNDERTLIREEWLAHIDWVFSSEDAPLCREVARAAVLEAFDRGLDNYGVSETAARAVLAYDSHMEPQRTTIMIWAGWRETMYLVMGDSLDNCRTEYRRFDDPPSPRTGIPRGVIARFRAIRTMAMRT